MDAMIKFTDAEPAKSKETTPKTGNKGAKSAATPETTATNDGAGGAPKMTAPKRKRSGAG